MFRTCFTDPQLRDKFYYMERAANTLDDAKILTEDNLNAFFRYADNDQQVCELEALNEAKILSQDNFNTLIRHYYPPYLLIVIGQLDSAGIVNQENFTLISTHTNSFEIATLLIKLK
jgi:hypothetical protein